MMKYYHDLELDIDKYHEDVSFSVAKPIELAEFSITGEDNTSIEVCIA